LFVCLFVWFASHSQVIVMEGGRVAEFGIPHVLLQNSSSYFSKLIDKTSRDTAQALRQQALAAYREIT
jgi:ATP-binding cassette subfamily C (CFTR/MRP) protein 4